MRAGSDTTRQAAPPRWALLDGLRLVAALMVVLFHYTAWHHSFWQRGEAAQVWSGLSFATAFGNLGVQLFFIISGLVVFRSLEGKSVGRFIGSRLGRIMPALWVAVFLSGALQLLLWRTPQPSLTWGDLGWNLTLVGAPLHGVPWVDGVYWTLWIEARFYLLLLLARWVLRRLHRDDVRGWTGIALAWVAAGLAVIALTGIPRIDSRWDWALSPTYCGLFAGGMMLHLISRHGASPLRLTVLAASVAQSAWATAADMPTETAQVTGITVPALAYAALVLGFFALVAALVFTPLRRVGWAWLSTAGALTYPVYLLHEVPGWYLIDHLSPAWPPWLVLPLTLAAVLVAAYAVNRWVERPLGPRLNRAVSSRLDGIGTWVAWTVRSRPALPSQGDLPGQCPEKTSTVARATPLDHMT